MAIRLLKEGFRVNCAIRPMNAGGRNWNRGTFVVRVTRNPDTVHEAVNRLAKELGVNVTAVNTGYAEEGDTPVGGENVYPLQVPRIAVVADEGVDQTSFGSIWWTLDRYGIDFTPMSLQNVKGGALKNYSILIMPDGAAGRYFGTLGKGGVDALKDWVQNGGTLITVRGASVFAALTADPRIAGGAHRLVGHAHHVRGLAQQRRPPGIGGRRAPLGFAGVAPDADGQSRAAAAGERQGEARHPRCFEAELAGRDAGANEGHGGAVALRQDHAAGIDDRPAPVVPQPELVELPPLRRKSSRRLHGVDIDRRERCRHRRPRPRGPGPRGAGSGRAPFRSALAFARARSSAFRARIAAMRCASGTSNCSGGRC